MVGAVAILHERFGPKWPLMVCLARIPHSAHDFMITDEQTKQFRLPRRTLGVAFLEQPSHVMLYLQSGNQCLALDGLNTSALAQLAEDAKANCSTSHIIAPSLIIAMVSY